MLASMLPHHGLTTRESTRTLSLSRKLDIARTFYRTVVGAVLPSSAAPSPHIAEIGGALMPDHSPHANLKHQVRHGFGGKLGRLQVLCVSNRLLILQILRNAISESAESLSGFFLSIGQ